MDFYRHMQPSGSLVKSRVREALITEAEALTNSF